MESKKLRFEKKEGYGKLIESNPDHGRMKGEVQLNGF